MAATKQGAGAPGPKFIILHNTTSAAQIITPDDDDRNGSDLVIRPFESIAVKRSVMEAWADDINLAAVLESGAVVKSESDVKPKPFPKEPDSGLSDPNERMVISIMVCGNDEEAQKYIGLTLEKDRVLPDSGYMRDSYDKILSAALAWLKQWGPPEELKWRVDAIEKRLAILRSEGK